MKQFRHRALLSLFSLFVAGLGWHSSGEIRTIAAGYPESSTVLVTQNAAEVAVVEHLQARSMVEEDHNLDLANTSQSNLAEAHTLTGRLADGLRNGSHQPVTLGERVAIRNTQIALYVLRSEEPLNPVVTLATFVVALGDIFGQNPFAPMPKNSVWSYEYQAFINLVDANERPGAIPRQPHTYNDIATALTGLGHYMTDTETFVQTTFTVWRTRGESSQSADAYLVAKGSVGLTAPNSERNNSAVSAPGTSPAAADTFSRPTTMATAFRKH